jgi:hypothetical protein
VPIGYRIETAGVDRYGTVHVALLFECKKIKTRTTFYTVAARGSKAVSATLKLTSGAKSWYPHFTEYRLDLQ